MSRHLPKMSNTPWAIRIDRLQKTFPVQDSHPTAFRVLGKLIAPRSGHAQSFCALEDINLEVSKGEKVAIVGNNGAGKTTLLKLIAGLYPPTAGEVFVQGEMILLRGLEIGMVEELSAAENLFLYGSIYGLERQKIKDKFNEIFKWAELEAFTEAKLGTLSSGMKARLGFSILRHVEAEIFLLDEALSAADRHFKGKYQEVFQNQRNSGNTFLIATHDLNFARMFCTKTLWLSNGKQMAFDATDKVLTEYINQEPLSVMDE